MMARFRQIVVFTLASFVITMSPGTAQTPLPPVDTAVIGVARTPDATPIRRAIVRLRDLRAGRIHGTVVSDVEGRFLFTGMPRGLYVTELLDDAGRVVAAGDIIAVEMGQRVVTSVVLSRLGMDLLAGAAALAGQGVQAGTVVGNVVTTATGGTSLFMSTAAAVISAATGAGILVAAPGSQPVTPER